MPHTYMADMNKGIDWGRGGVIGWDTVGVCVGGVGTVINMGQSWVVSVGIGLVS